MCVKKYEFVNFTDKLHIQYNILSSFQTASVSDTAKIHSKILWMMKNQTNRHRKYTKLSAIKFGDPETDNLGKVLK